IKNHHTFGPLANKILSEIFKFYEEMTKAGIPGEDARYLLPLYTKTNIQTALNARELCHLFVMSGKYDVPSVVRSVIVDMLFLAKKRAPYLFEDFGANYEQLAWYPSSQLYAENNKTMMELIGMSNVNHNVVMLGQPILNKAITAETLREAVRNRNEAELANLKHVHFEFLAKMSLACFHQATRQRTWNQSVESVYDAARRGHMFIPESVRISNFANRYSFLHWKLVGLYEEMTQNGIPKQEAIGVIPHSLMVYDWIHVNGWNAIHAIGKRTCTKAQLEIRNIASKMVEYIKAVAPIFQEYVEPQCVTYGKCPEKDSCGYCKNS
ncbi:MAG: FAD-dependent thymidylate synthase, partial [Patescibacteria group bacterium]